MLNHVRLGLRAPSVIRGRPGLLDRPTLPSGHPITWGAITDGTVLQREVYPYPVFLGEGDVLDQPPSSPGAGASMTGRRAVSDAGVVSLLDAVFT